jgi:hypothetical protein
MAHPETGRLVDRFEGCGRAVTPATRCRSRALDLPAGPA